MIREAMDKFLESGVVRSSFVTCESARLEWIEGAPHWVQRKAPDRVNWFVANNWTADDVIP
jgi:pimeloyl-ACP methyl ester carboxylesterase